MEWKKQKMRLSGYEAQIVQHECDHLEGVIIGILVPTTKRKPVGIVAAIVFIITYVLLMPRYFMMLFKEGK